MAASREEEEEERRRRGGGRGGGGEALFAIENAPHAEGCIQGGALFKYTQRWGEALVPTMFGASRCVCVCVCV